MEITIEQKIPRWALQLDKKYRYIFIKGGRSSSKSWGVADYLVERSITEKDLRIVGLREIQKSIKWSSKSLVDNTIKRHGLEKYYRPIEGETRKILDSGLFLFQGMNDLTADNIKSLEGFKIAWFEEAQNMSAKSLKILRPTIREKDSQIIFTWNPKFPNDPIEEFCNQMRDEPDCLIIHVNYTENPFLSDVVRREIAVDRRKNPEDFEHIWLGKYDTTFHGHYYAQLLQAAEDEGRISDVPIKPGVDFISAWDLGMRDATAIWVAQIVGLQPRIIDYYENNFEELDHYADWMKERGYENAMIGLPFDGAHERLGMKGSIRDQLRTMGLKNVDVMEKITVDAGMALAKTLIKEAYFDRTRCSEGIKALRRYRSEKDEKSGLFKFVHDWSSHGSDAWRYLAQKINKKPEVAVKKVSYSLSGGRNYL